MTMSANATQAPLAPLEGAPRVWLTIALAAAAFMQVLDSTIANVAIPTISGDLGASSSQGTWIITSFGVTNAIALPLTGWLAKRFGEVRLFLVSTVLFVLASFLCGIAHSLDALVFFRILQGACAGPMMPLSQSLLLANYPPEKRPIALAFWGMTVTVAPICGPILGGYISDNFHWGWIFFINIPVGFLLCYICWRVLRERESAIFHQPMNYIGLILLVVGVGSLQLMLDRGKELDWFNSPEILWLAIISVVGISFLIVWELTDKNPVVDVKLFRSRNFNVGVICISLGMFIYFGTIVLLPLLLQKYMQYTATLAGIATAPIGILPLILAPVIGKNAHRLDMRILATISFIVFAACMYARTTFAPSMDFWWIVIPQFLQGLAIACFFMPITNITFAGLPANQLAGASSLFNFIRTLFASIGASVTITLWERREAVHHTFLTEHISLLHQPAIEVLDKLQRIGLQPLQAYAYLEREVTRQGFFIAANEVYWLCSILFLFLTVLIWFSRPNGNRVVPTDSAH